MKYIPAVSAAVLTSEITGLPLVDLVDRFAEIPAADVVEVVRCGECRHMENQMGRRFCGVWCHVNGMGDAGFCNYGERRPE